mmetsp:Transcript_10997/g.28414  ORF Transcript_10997/g.28414 Transcript_10997/m.28414 type:complete len:97 (-) Transcript_10997:175-465(-)
MQVQVWLCWRRRAMKIFCTYLGDQTSCPVEQNYRSFARATNSTDFERTPCSVGRKIGFPHMPDDKRRMTQRFDVVADEAVTEPRGIQQRDYLHPWH